MSRERITPEATAEEEHFIRSLRPQRLDECIGQGKGFEGLRISTLAGATTRAGLLSSPLRERFGIVHHLDFFPVEDLQKVVLRSAAILGVPVTEEGALEIARRARGTPRIANRLLRRVRDLAPARPGAVVANL